MKKLYFILPIALLLVVAVYLLIFKQERPDKAFHAYLDQWQAMNYDEMYEQLSSASKTTITKEDFAKRYQSIYDGIEASQLQITLIPQDNNQDKDQSELQYHVKMNTLAGPLEFNHKAIMIKENKRWVVKWDPSLIFPQLKPGDKVRAESQKAQRGEILDRNGRQLAVNGTGTEIGIVPGRVGANPEASKQKVASLLNMPVDEITKKLSASWVKPDYFVPIAVIPNESLHAFLSIPGVDYQQKKIRSYPLKEAAAHLTGYIGEVNADELQKLKDKGYIQGDLIGKSGLEQIFEDKLRGQDGGRIYIVDAAGKETAKLAEKAAVNGETIKLTIDAAVQNAVYDELKEDAGAAAAIHPKTGEVLALVSTPAYDPNAFIRGVSDQQWEKWNSDPHKPLLNRFASAYAPGSVFKPITAAIGLDTGILNPDIKRKISGLHWTKDESWGNYNVTRVHEENDVDLQKALVYSDNIYFAQVALEIGKNKFAEEARKFGIGETIPFQFPIQQSKFSNAEITSEAQLADSGFGQGEVQMTPLHVALAYSAIVNEGNIPAPYLSVDNNTASGKVWKEKTISPAAANRIRNDLIQVVNNPNGTGHQAQIPGITVAAKTGTAELKSSINENGQENGWFAAFNTDSPKVLIAMMVEDVKNRGGSSYLAPKIKRILQQVLK